MNDPLALSILRAKLDRTEEELDQSIRRYRGICADVKKGLLDPDGKHLMELAADAETAAKVAYATALREFDEFLVNGAVPEGISKTEQRQVVQCAFCGIPTPMYRRDLPVCADCDSRLDAGETLTRK